MPKILDDRVEAVRKSLSKSGDDSKDAESKAYAIAIKGLQKEGKLKKGTTKLKR